MKKTYIAAFAVLVMALTVSCSKKEAPVEAESIPVEDVLDQDGNIDSAFAALDDDAPLTKPTVADSTKAKDEADEKEDKDNKKEDKKKGKKKDSKKDSDSENK